MLGKLFARNGSTGLGRGIAKNAVGSFGVKLGSLGITFITNILLARIMGANAYGTFIYAFTWATFLAIVPSLGLSEYLVREIAVYNARSQWGLLSGLLRWSNSLVLSLSVIAIFLSIGVGWFLGLNASSPSSLVFWLALLTIPLINLTGLRQGVMKGFNQIIIGDFPELLVRPVLFITLVMTAHLLLGNKLDVTWVMVFHVLSVAIAFGFGSWLLLKILPDGVKSVRSVYQTRAWLSSTMPFLMLVCVYVVNQQTAVLMLGAMKGADAAGIYSVVCRGAQLSQFALAAVYSATSPVIATLYSKQDIDGLKRVAQGSTRMLFLGSSIISGAFVLFGHEFLLIFGHEFVQGEVALFTLALGFLLDSFSGSLAGLLLLMSGNEQDTAIGTGISAGLNVLLNAILIPIWGLEGAAISTVISTLFRSLYFVVYSKKRLGFIPNPIF